MKICIFITTYCIRKSENSFQNQLKFNFAEQWRSDGNMERLVSTPLYANAKLRL